MSRQYENEASLDSTATDSLLAQANEDLAQLNLPPLAIPGLGPLRLAIQLTVLITSGISEKSKRIMQWTMTVWKEWAVFRLSSPMLGEEATH